MTQFQRLVQLAHGRLVADQRQGVAQRNGQGDALFDLAAGRFDMLTLGGRRRFDLAQTADQAGQQQRNLRDSLRRRMPRHDPFASHKVRQVENRGSQTDVLQAVQEGREQGRRIVVAMLKQRTEDRRHKVRVAGRIGDHQIRESRQDGRSACRRQQAGQVRPRGAGRAQVPVQGGRLHQDRVIQRRRVFGRAALQHVTENRGQKAVLNLGPLGRPVQDSLQNRSDLVRCGVADPTHTPNCRLAFLHVERSNLIQVRQQCNNIIAQASASVLVSSAPRARWRRGSNSCYASIGRRILERSNGTYTVAKPVISQLGSVCEESSGDARQI